MQQGKKSSISVPHICPRRILLDVILRMQNIKIVCRKLYNQWDIFYNAAWITLFLGIFLTTILELISIKRKLWNNSLFCLYYYYIVGLKFWNLKE